MMNFKMWGQALRIIPQVSKSEWFELDIISRWLISTRAAVLVMTFLSAAIAGMLAFLDGAFDWGRWGLVTIGLILAHATNNLINDLIDHIKGVDKDNYFRAQYGPQPLEHGLLSMKQMLTYIFITGMLALVPGLYLVWQLGTPVLWLLLGGAFFVLFYTFPLKYFGLGEIAVLIVWGPLMIGGGYFVITGGWNWNVIIASLPYAIGVTTVLFGKHIDKFDEDKAKHIYTLPVIIGEQSARAIVITMIVAQYALVIYLVAIRFFSPFLLIIALALPLMRTTIRSFLQPKPDSPPEDYPSDGWPIWFVGHAFLHNRRWGSFFLLGLILAAILEIIP